ncbi:hypothetical protein LXL04_010257 [Taraxacum kok-saghyz]
MLCTWASCSSLSGKQTATIVTFTQWTIQEFVKEIDIYGYVPTMTPQYKQINNLSMVMINRITSFEVISNVNRINIKNEIPYLTEKESTNEEELEEKCWVEKRILNIQKCGSNKYSLGSCISVYNHTFAFPELVAIPATKRGNGGGGKPTSIRSSELRSSSSSVTRSIPLNLRHYTNVYVCQAPQFCSLFGTRFLPAHPTSEDKLGISRNYRELSEFGNWFQPNCSFLRITMIFTVNTYTSRYVVRKPTSIRSSELRSSSSSVTRSIPLNLRHYTNVYVCQAPVYNFLIVFFSNSAGLFGTRFLPAHPTLEGKLGIYRNYRELSEFGNWFQPNCSFLRITMIFTVMVRVSVKTGTTDTVVPFWQP